MNLFFEFFADKFSPLESFVVVSASCAGRLTSGDLSRCRIMLDTAYGKKQRHLLISKDRSFRIELTSRLELVNEQQREDDQRCALRLEIPMALGKASSPISFAPG